MRSGDEIFTRVRWAEGAFWATGFDFVSGGLILTSSDGEHWEVISGELNLEYVEFSDVAVNQETVVAVGFTRGKTRFPVIATKRIDEDWTSQSFPERGQNFTSVVWTGERFFVGSYLDDGILLASFDGLNWFPQEMGFPMSVRWFESNGDQTVGIGKAGNTNQIVSSSDGDVWVQSFLSQQRTLFDLIWTGEHFVAVGADGNILTSRNGVAWNREKVGFGVSMSAVAGDNSNIYTGGWGGSIFRASYNPIKPRMGEGRVPAENPPPANSIFWPVD